MPTSISAEPNIGVEEELVRRVLPVAVAPPADEEVHRDEHDLEEDEEHEQVERDERRRCSRPGGCSSQAKYGLSSWPGDRRPAVASGKSTPVRTMRNSEMPSTPRCHWRCPGRRSRTGWLSNWYPRPAGLEARRASRRSAMAAASPWNTSAATSFGGVRPGPRGMSSDDEAPTAGTRTSAEVNDREGCWSAASDHRFTLAGSRRTEQGSTAPDPEEQGVGADVPGLDRCGAGTGAERTSVATPLTAPSITLRSNQATSSRRAGGPGPPMNHGDRSSIVPAPGQERLLDHRAGVDPALQ